MTRRKKITISLFFTCLALIGVGTLAEMTKNFTDFTFQKEEEDVLGLKPLDNISFQSVTEKRLSDGTVRKEITYFITPAEAYDEEFNYALVWNEATTAGKESDTWKDGKNPEDYMTYQVDTAAHKITLDCSQAFGHQLLFEMSAVSNPDVKASLTIDYRRKVLSNASINVTPTFDPGKTMQVTRTVAVHSIGTIGEKAKDFDIDISMAYYDNGTSYDDLFGSIITSGIYSKSYKYKGTTYTDTTKLRNAIKTNVDTYLKSIPTKDGSKTFLIADLKTEFRYSYCAYHTYTDVYLNTEDLFNTFVTKYNTAYANGSGYKLSVVGGDVITYDSLVKLNIDSSTITDITFSNGNVEF